MQILRQAALHFCLNLMGISEKSVMCFITDCTASRPTIESKTNEDEKEVQTETLTIKARPMADGYVKAKTGDATTDTVYNNWYKSVYQPTAVCKIN